MSTPLVEVLQRYIDEIKNDTDKEAEALSKTDTVAAEASILGVSVGTLSQLRNGKPITDRVIEKIAKKIAGSDASLKDNVRKELEMARDLSISAAITNNSLDAFRRFFETNLDDKRLICIAYRDIPQSRDKGNYPGYIDESVTVIRNGLACAMFQPFGPLNEIKKKAKEAYDEDDVEAIDKWNYIYQLASGVQEVFEKTKRAVADGKCKGQIVLYAALKIPSLTVSSINSRICYSLQISAKDKINKVRIVQLIKGPEKDQETFIECSAESGFQAAVAAQFYPIVQYWRDTGSLPLKQDKLKTYYSDNEECLWEIYH